MVGTISYASLNNHQGIRLSRRDDIESAAYVLLYLAAGRLPWPKSGNTSQKQIRKIGQQKRACDIAEFCRQVGIPVEFATVIDYARHLSYAMLPDYQYIRNLYRRISHGPGSSTNISLEKSGCYIALHSTNSNMIASDSISSNLIFPEIV